jgi:hypothetical protein
LLEPFFDARENPKQKKIRLIGVRVEKLLWEPSGVDARAHLALGNEAGLDRSDETEEVRG